MELSRYYNSRPAVTAAGIVGGAYFYPLGNWRTNFDRDFFQLTNGNILFVRPDGQMLQFTPNGSGWSTDSDLDYQLTTDGTGDYYLTCPDDSLEWYKVDGYDSSNIIHLQQINFRNGNVWAFQRTSFAAGDFSNVLGSVTDSYNRKFTFNWNSSGTLTSITTPDNTIDYGFNSSGQLTTVTYPTSPASTITYNYGQNSAPATALTSMIDEDGNTYATWTYDANSRGLTSALGGSGLNANLTTVTYNDTNGSRTVTNAFGVTDTYSFTTLQGVPKVTQISRAATTTTAAATETFSYDSSGYRSSFTDWNGNQTTYVNASNGLPTTINEAVGTSAARTTTIIYDTSASPKPLPHSPLTIVTPGLTTSFTYDSDGDVLTKTLTDTTTQNTPYSTNGQTRTWTNTWSNFLLASVKTPNGNTTTFGYNSGGALTSITDALSHVTNISWVTAGGRPLTVVDPNGAANGTTTTLTYDNRQRLTSKAVATSSSGTQTTTYTLDAAGNLTKITLPDNSFISYVYDAAHRVTKATNALSEYQTYALDALGDTTQTNTYDSSNNQWRQQARTFDALGRFTQYTGGIGTNGQNTTSYTYDANGNLLTVKDGNNHTTTRVFDALNRLSKSTDANSGVIQLAYDAHDRPLTVTDPNSNATSYVYDGFGDAIQQASLDTGTTVYHYDADANLTSKTDALNVTTNYTYDALDRIKSRTGTGVQWAYFGYDTNDWSQDKGSIGRLSWVNDPAGYLYFGDDAFGNVYHRQRQTQSQHVVNDLWINHDPVNRVSGVSYPSGLWVAYNRDAAGQLDNVQICPPGSQTCPTVDWTAYAPFFGPLRYETSGNNMRDVKGTDADYRTAQLAIQQNGGSTNLTNQTLSYDAANNLTSVTDTVSAFNNQTLGYDVINRLTSAASGTGGYGSLAWTYDKVGNLQSQTVNSSATTYGYTSGSNRLASITNGGTITVTTDANGNITSIPPAGSGTAATFTYSGNRLTSVTGPPMAISAIVYDGFGQRYSKQNPGSPNTYVYDLDGTLIEENDDGFVTDYIYNNGILVGLWVPSTSKLYFVHTNQQGTPLMVSDSNQNIVWSTIYWPYGTTPIPTGSVTQNVRLPGQYSDGETGFNYNGFRDYMPNLAGYGKTRQNRIKQATSQMV